MYILLGTDAFGAHVGGIETYQNGLAHALQRIGRKIHVIATEYEGAAEHDGTATFPVTRVPTGRGRILYKRLRDEAIRIAGQRSGPIRGIIAAKWLPEAVSALQAAHSLRLPWAVFGYDREHILCRGRGALAIWFAQVYLYRKANYCFAISNYAAANFRRRTFGDNVYMVGCGVDSERFHPDFQRAEALRTEHGLHGKRILLTVARLTPTKGHITVLEALPRIRQQIGDVHYLIVGAGDGSFVKQEVAQRCLKEHVTFTGLVPHEDLNGYYTLSEIMVMPSINMRGRINEGFGLTYIEANCCGTPVIGTRIGGVEDAIDHGVSGLLVPQCNPQAVAQAVIRILSDDQLAARMGEYARHRARDMFSWESVARRVDACFDAIW
jgi:phosphatidylinositol alpha-1,6-mannosyltransferase